MKLHQLELLCAVVDCGLSISNAARAAHTSQPSVSRHLQALEQELGFEVFERQGGRIKGLSVLGEPVCRAARRILAEIDALKTLGPTGRRKQCGHITVAASHTHARYFLRNAVKSFATRYPQVRLTLREGDSAQIIRLLATGCADVAISPEVSEVPRNLVCLPCCEHQRVILTPKQHPLLRIRQPTLRDLSAYPLITYDTQFTVHKTVVEVFRNAGLIPNIVLSATDVDVMKTYVKCGVGIAIVASVAFDAREDKQLRKIDASHLFRPNSVKVWLRRRTPLPTYIYDFIGSFSPLVGAEHIHAAVFGD